MKIGLPPQGKQGRNERRHFRWEVHATDTAGEPLTAAAATLDGTNDSGYAGCAISRLPRSVPAAPCQVRRH